MKGAAEFFLDFLVSHPKYGWLVTNPSTSPENFPLAPGNDRFFDEVAGSMSPAGFAWYRHQPRRALKTDSLNRHPGLEFVEPVQDHLDRAASVLPVCCACGVSQ